MLLLLLRVGHTHHHEHHHHDHYHHHHRHRSTFLKARDENVRERSRLQRQQQLLLSSWYRVLESNETHIRTHTHAATTLPGRRQNSNLELQSACDQAPKNREKQRLRKKCPLDSSVIKKNRVSTKKVKESITKRQRKECVYSK